MDVRDVGVALWRQRALALLVVVVTAGTVVVGLWLAPRTYTATTTIAVTAAPDRDADAERASLAELARSAGVVDEARDDLAAERSTDELRRAVEGTWVRGTTLVQISAEDRDPEVATAIASTVAETLAGRADEADQDSGVEVVLRDPATVPQSPSSPDVRLTAALGALLALGLATAAAVARDRRTHTADDATDVETAAAAPLLAHLRAPEDPMTLPALVAGSAEAAAFRHVRTALERGDGGPTVLTGVGPGETHVWVGANVAIALAVGGRRVLLVDGRVGERFGAPGEEAPDTPGLYDVLLGADLGAALSPGPVAGLRVLPPGTPGEEPVAELLAGRFAAVARAAAADFDHVLVLAPPLDECDDARLMAADGALVLTLVEGEVATSALRAHADRVRAVGARLLGVVLVAPAAERVPA